MSKVRFSNFDTL
jgi:hypothetical protein